MDAERLLQQPPDGMPSPGEDRPVSPPAELCAHCHQPLTRRGQRGECLRCALRLALVDDADADRETPTSSPALPPFPLRYGHFEIARGADQEPVELGSGAMATTYRAQDTVLHLPVALKVINRRVARHSAGRARFLREARAAARLHHPNVASVTFYGEQEGECFYAMELVEGETLTERIQRLGPLGPGQALEVGVQVARALAAAEAIGVVHRDLKPSNLMLGGLPGAPRPDELRVKVIDWGLAKAVDTQADPFLGADQTREIFVGTPAFASPEQFAGGTDEEKRRVDTRSDIYSLGVTLWYSLCGKTPFAGDTLDAIHARQRILPVEQLAAARVPRPLVGALKRMLAFDPADRPQSARELLDLLRRCQQGRGADGWKTARQPPLVWLAFGLSMLAATAGVWMLRRPHVPGGDVAGQPGQNLSTGTKKPSPAQPPSRDPAALALYSKVHGHSPHSMTNAERCQYNLEVRVPALEAAVARDPHFMAAYCDLAEAYGFITSYESGAMQSEAAAKHRILAENALAAARRLQPDAGEVHRAQAYSYLMESSNYELARQELDRARLKLPDDDVVESLAASTAYIQLRWDDAIRSAERAVALRPDNVFYRSNVAFMYEDLRRYADVERELVRVVAAVPPADAVKFNLDRALARLEERADVPGYRAVVEACAKVEGAPKDLIARHGLLAAFLSHDPAGMTAVLASTDQKEFNYISYLVPGKWFEAMAARMRHDDAAASAAFRLARVEVERRVQMDPREVRPLGLLALIDAALGNTEQALREAEHARDLCRAELWSQMAPVIACDLAVVYAWDGKLDLACATLEPWITHPAGLGLLRQLTYGDLKLNPLWDPLRGYPRFEALVARLAPRAAR